MLVWGLLGSLWGDVGWFLSSCQDLRDSNLRELMGSWVETQAEAPPSSWMAAGPNPARTSTRLRGTSASHKSLMEEL